MLDQLQDDHDDHQEDDTTNANAAVDLLPRLALEQAIGAAGMARIASESSLCLVIRVPDQSWITPLSRCLRELGAFSTYLNAREKPRRKDEDTSATLARCLSRGEKAFGLSPDPQSMLPPVLVSAADLYLDLPGADGTLLAAVVQAVTGETVEVPDAVARALTFEQAVTSIRQGSTGRECLERLSAAASKRDGSSTGLESAVPVEDLIGYGEAKTWALNLVQDLDAWRAGKADFDSMESRVVLWGPPGTGKTTFAKSAAASAGIPLFATSAAAWFLNGTGYLDGVIKQMDGVFEAARAAKPAMIFIDELDAVPDRASLSPRNRDWWLPVVGHLLTLLDGASESNRDLVIVGATNYPDRLDDALIRPGRLSRLIEIGMPSIDELSLILRQHLREDLAGVDLSAFGSMMGGATGADVAETCKRARARARRAGRPMVLDDLICIIAPLDERPADLTERISIHEAGHAVVAHLQGSGRIRTISLISDSGSEGSVTFERDDLISTRVELEQRVVQLLGGRAAEQVLMGSVGTGSGGGNQSDLARATGLVASLHATLGLGETLSFRGHGDNLGVLLQMDVKLASVVERELRCLHERAETIIADNALLVREVAEALRGSRYLSGDDFRRIVERTEGRHAGR